MSTDSSNQSTSSLRIGFLGPAGTFSEQVILRLPDLALAELVPYPLMTDVLFAVAEGEIDQGVVPVENAIEGTVNAIVDTMAFDVDLLIQREMLEPVSLNLLVQPGASIDQVTRLIAIPVASSQCRTWLRDHLPAVEYVAANSNAQAAEFAAEANDPTVAALANVRAAELYGLEVGAAEIEDHPENSTRFVLVSRSGVPAPTGQDKTSIVVYQRADTPVGDQHDVVGLQEHQHRHSGQAGCDGDQHGETLQQKRSRPPLAHAVSAVLLCRGAQCDDSRAQCQRDAHDDPAKEPCSQGRSLRQSHPGSADSTSSSSVVHYASSVR